MRIQGEEKEKETESIFNTTMDENFSNVGREADIQIQEAQRTPNSLNPNRATLRHTVIKLSKVKDRILKAREKLHTREPLEDYWWISQQKLFRPEENEMTYSKH